jgi:DNA-binding SARP family transcriptional activator
MNTLYIQTLGQMRITSSEHPTVERFRTRKCAELLGLLVRQNGAFVSRETLGELLWPGEPSRVQRSRLRYELCQLRPFLPATNIKTYGQDLISLSSASDYETFERASRQALRLPRGESRLEALETALGLYTGTFLPGHFADWVVAEREHLEALRTDLLQRISADCAVLGLREASRYWERKLLV